MDLGSGAARCEGSSPFIRTTHIIGNFKRFNSHFKKIQKIIFYYKYLNGNFNIKCNFHLISPIQVVSATPD
jgi:uncharacterized protein YwgA